MTRLDTTIYIIAKRHSRQPVPQLDVCHKMSAASDTIEIQQRICAKHCAPFFECSDDDRAGIALASLKSEPIYGARERNEDGTTSWYVWGGPYSTVEDFFQPICAGHIRELLPEAVPYLALPPGYKFIIDRSGFEDVWLEENRSTNEPAI